MVYFIQQMMNRSTLFDKKKTKNNNNKHNEYNYISKVHIINDKIY